MTIHDPDLEEAGGCHSLFRGAPSSVEFNKLRKRLLRNTRQAIEDFAMVRPGERWLVALSGGKDSYGLLALLLDLKWRGLLPVDLLACNLDQGQPNFPKHILPEFLDPARHRRTASNTRTPIRSSPTRSPRATPIARSARGCGAAISTASRARRAARRWCSAITARTSSRPSS